MSTIQFIKLLVVTVTCLTLNNDAFAQNTRARMQPGLQSSISSGINKLGDIKRRIQNMTRSDQESWKNIDYEGDRQLRQQSAMSNNRYQQSMYSQNQQVNRASRIASNANYQRAVGQTYYQEPAYDDATFEDPGFGFDQGSGNRNMNLPPQQSYPQDFYPTPTTSNANYRDQGMPYQRMPNQGIGMNAGMANQGIPNAPYLTPQAQPQPQPQRNLMNQRQGFAANQNQDPRFRHFTGRMSATERVLQLESSFSKLEKSLKAAQAENTSLQRKLDERDQFILEIQKSVDEAVVQLTAAADTNQQLKTRIDNLEQEKIQQKEASEKLFNEVRQQLNQLLASELSNNGG